MQDAMLKCNFKTKMRIGGNLAFLYHLSVPTSHFCCLHAISAVLHTHSAEDGSDIMYHSTLTHVVGRVQGNRRLQRTISENITDESVMYGCSYEVHAPSTTFKSFAAENNGYVQIAVVQEGGDSADSVGSACFRYDSIVQNFSLENRLTLEDYFVVSSLNATSSVLKFERCGMTKEA